MLLHGLRRVRPEAFADRPGQLEMLFHELPQVEPRRAARRAVAGGDLRRCEPRPGVGERFRIREETRELDVMKQSAQVVSRIIQDRLGEVRGGSGGCGGCLGAPDRHEESCGNPNKPPPTSPTSPTSPNLPQPCLSHRKMIHSTPMVAARTIDRTTLRRRGPAGTGT